MVFNAKAEVEEFNDKRKEAEEMSTVQPRKCSNCLSCGDCSDKAVEISRKQQVELRMIEDNVFLNKKLKKVEVQYPAIKDFSVLTDNREQVIERTKSLERRLISTGMKDGCDGQVKDFIARGVLVELSDDERNNYDGPVNYLDHHGVQSDSATTPYRCIMTFRSYPHVVVFDLSKCYQQMYTGEKEKHLRRIVCDYVNVNDCNTGADTVEEIDAHIGEVRVDMKTITKEERQRAQQELNKDIREEISKSRVKEKASRVSESSIIYSVGGDKEGFAVEGKRTEFYLAESLVIYLGGKRESLAISEGKHTEVDIEVFEMVTVKECDLRIKIKRNKMNIASAQDVIITISKQEFRHGSLLQEEGHLGYGDGVCYVLHGRGVDLLSLGGPCRVKFIFKLAIQKVACYCLRLSSYNLNLTLI